MVTVNEAVNSDHLGQDLLDKCAGWRGVWPASNSPPNIPNESSKLKADGNLYVLLRRSGTGCGGCPCKPPGLYSHGARGNL